VGATQQLIVTAPRFVVDAADFDGTSDYMTRGGGLTGAADGGNGLFSVWARIDGGNSTQRRLFNAVVTAGGTDQRVGLDLQSANGGEFQAFCHTSAGGFVLAMNTTTAYLAGTTWRHFLAAWKTATPAVGYIYMNDVQDKAIVPPNIVADASVDLTLGDWAVGAYSSGAQKFNGALAELFFHNTYLDITVESNRRKFIDSNGKPVNLGSDGSLPLGVSPLVYLHLDDGEAVANFATNRGTGGNFSITGTLDTASTSPTD
jgi:hypothetical protein